MPTDSTNRTTIRLPDKLHRRLKVLAAERGVTMQELLEAALNVVVEGGLDRAARRRGRSLVIPAHMEPTVGAFIRFWQNPKDSTEEQIRRLVELVLENHPDKQTTPQD